MAARNDVKRVENRSVLHLIDDGLCSVSDVRKATRKAELLSSGRIAEKVSDLERLLKVMGDRNRITIMVLLMEREMCVCELMAAMRTSQPTTSRNLSLLEHVGLVRKRRRGKWAFYSLADSIGKEVIRAHLFREGK